MKTLIDTKEEKTIADELYEAVKELSKEQQRDVKVMIMTAKMLFGETDNEQDNEEVTAVEVWNCEKG